MERAGLPTVHVCAIGSVASMVGSRRVVAVESILHPTGDPNLDPKMEKAMRRAILERALVALSKEETGEKGSVA